MSHETNNTGDDPLVPSSPRDDLDTPSLGRFYDEAEKQLGPEAPHFDVVKRALDLWEQETKRQERPRQTPPGRDAQ